MTPNDLWRYIVYNNLVIWVTGNHISHCWGQQPQQLWPWWLLWLCVVWSQWSQVVTLVTVVVKDLSNSFSHASLVSNSHYFNNVVGSPKAICYPHRWCVYLKCYFGFPHAWVHRFLVHFKNARYVVQEVKHTKLTRNINATFNRTDLNLQGCNEHIDNSSTCGLIQTI